MPTLRELERRGISLSRVEEAHPHGWLGQVQRDPSEVPVRGWFDDRQPTEAEEREHGHTDR